MGQLIYCQWGNLIAMVGGVIAILGGSLACGFPMGTFEVLRPALDPIFFKPFPLLAVFAIVFGLITLALEWPLPFVHSALGDLAKDYRFRVAIYFPAAVLLILVNQCVNAGLYLLIASIVYGVAASRGEYDMKAGSSSGKT